MLFGRWWTSWFSGWYTFTATVLDTKGYVHQFLLSGLEFCILQVLRLETRIQEGGNLKDLHDIFRVSISTLNAQLYTLFNVGCESCVRVFVL